MNFQDILTAAIRQSAVDCSCSEDDFRSDRNIVVESKANPEASRYMTLPHICSLFSYGSNIVASCRKDLIPEIESFIRKTEKIHRCFETPGIYELNRILGKDGARISWMHTCFLPDPERVFRNDLPCSYRTELLRHDDFADLYLPEWGNALCADRKELDVLGVGAYDGERMIGLAGCSADCPGMWQIGIDVLPEYRRQGIAAYLTNRLAQAVFDCGKIPFYAAAWSNVRSIRNALKSGFVPSWVAVTASKADS